MSLQQVNLYLPQFRPKQEWLTASSLMVSFVGLILIFVTFHIVASVKLKRLEQQTVVLEDRQVAAERQLQKFRAESKPFADNQLALQLSYLRTALAGREQVEKIIEWQNLGNSVGFSGAFKGLARQSIATITLNRISLSPRMYGGQLLQLKGVTTQPEDVATYIQRLRLEPSFSYVNFGLLSVVADEKSSRHLFTLGYDSVYKVAVTGGDK